MNFKGRRVLVVGLGLSGLAAARYLNGQGARVRATDNRPADKLGPQARELEQAGVELILGEHPQDIFTQAELIVVSPGVPLSLPGLAAARKAGVEIVGEMGLAASLIDLDLVAVSGTNGKSTTTALIAHLLEASGKKVFLGGNIGRPLIEYPMSDRSAQVGVIEVSSYQLESMPRFGPKVAVLTNVSPDHLDRHGSFEAYGRAKARLWADLGPEDWLIINRDDKASTTLARDSRTGVLTFGLTRAEGPGASPLDRVRAFLSNGLGARAEVDISGWNQPGGHNLENLMAALLAAWLMGADPEAMGLALSSFKALPHRLEWVGNKGGVDFYDDSKATNVISAAKAVAGFDRPVILIAGGLDKGAGYAELAEAGQGRLKAAVLIGRAAELMAGELKGVCPVHLAGELKPAFEISLELARPGDVVLLSPACASFDQFENFNKRGEAFRALVEELN